MNDKITCPNCSHQFDVEEALSGQIQAQLRKEYEEKLQKQANVFRNKENELKSREEEFEKKREQQNELFKKRLDEKLALEKEKNMKETQEQFQQKLLALQEENEKRKEENRTLKQKEIDLLKKENALKEQQEELMLQMEKEVLKRQNEIEEGARKKEREAFELEKLQLLKQIEDNKKLAEEMKRKAEQGSMQLQGEVQEIALETFLMQTYPFDFIEEVPKGINGADVIQNVRNRLQQDCGKIVYESKRTKNFDNKWIDKLKQDQVRVKGDIAVLVTQTLPKGMNQFDFMDGIWICRFDEIKSVSNVLRELILATHNVKSTEANKGDKMELLYNYLTSNDFVQKVKRIVETYDSMIHQLNSEKKTMFRMWSEREKQIWLVQENVNALFGDIKGIAGNTLGDGNLMELEEPEIQ